MTKRREVGYLELRKELKRRMEELGKVPKGARTLPDPMPPGIRIGVLPKESWVKVLQVRPKNPEAWDLCVNFLGDYECYRKAVDLWHNKNYYGIILRAVMFGADVRAVIEALHKGDYQKARELAYHGKIPLQEMDEILMKHKGERP
ncbi:hypothetical protein [Pyrobaculum aerophilum]|uniref:Uncharacterized protein n=1 Tax=Pyrobaculum aerophilum TaxID=13773 RepID=A0A371QZB0_9CREN|nr:hypothetical protein [Pyrobaculum aerophilum]RFA95817.1 hypothetical protein CGL52_12200 [Pyrobaculum aerophilum]RFA96168.1 hypothetical protein CGL51_05745 [Pyrobaculum aerophilum]